MKWNNISIKPENGETVLAIWKPKFGRVDAKCFSLAKYIDGEWINPDSDWDVYAQPTHWMPLPNPPKD